MKEINNTDIYCKNCKFFYELNTFNTGQCRRHSPERKEESVHDNYTRVWPIIKHDDWCGDFKQKEEYGYNEDTKR